MKKTVTFFVLFSLIISCASVNNSRNREGNNIGQQRDVTVEDDQHMFKEELPKIGKDYPPAKNREIQNYNSKTQMGSSIDKEPEGVVGKAFYYAKRYSGRKTSSGEIYDPEKLTAAHPTIPLGTRVKVLNIANERSVVVTVNDRCRKRTFELIDLSRAAARELGILVKGTAMVRIIPMVGE